MMNKSSDKSVALKCESCKKTHSHDCHEGECGCSHEHTHEEEISKLKIILVAFSVVLLVAALSINIPALKIVLYILSVLIAGYDLFILGLKELVKLKLEENALLLVAVTTSFIIGEFPEACIVTILFKIGSFLESYAISRSKKSMKSLVDIREEHAILLKEDGTQSFVLAKEVNVGDIILVRAGDKIALDCVILSGISTIDSSALTGESLPAFVKEEDTLLSGSINIGGVLTCKVINDYDNSAASKIIELCYSSSLNKGKTEKFISKFARIYTPTVIILAVLMAIIPPIFGLGTLNDWVMRGLIFLVASCPCALVISIPLSFFAGIGACSKKGVLIKGSQFIETLSKVNAVAFDKTGTLTSGKLEIESIVFSKDVDKDKTLMLLASTEKYSSHPIAQTILNYYKKDDFVSFSDVKEVAGYGICAKSSDGERFICGGTNILDKYGIVAEDEVKANIYFVQGQKIIARIYLKEEISVDGQNIVQKLRKIGINDVVMLTGDNEASGLKVASKCGISKTFCSLLPTDKVQKVNELKKTNCVLFVGDGINDAPVLSSADVGVSMGLGSEVANETSDIILVENRISFLPKAISIARHCMNIVYFNIAFAILIKLIVLILGFLGLGTMWMAVFADIGVTIISVINSVRILKVKKK